ncbi:hypothetical protein [Erythrobacter aureus]|uniref:hypothetical protein n=1 Tax=Erythrobacter aureus TaxID=2182384 RepID=UPI003A9094D7
MISEEAKALPGGFLAILLLWLGAGSLFVSLLLLALQAGSPGFLGGMSSTWLAIPAWGLVAMTLAIILRRGGNPTARVAAAIWLLLGVVSLIALELNLENLPFA